MISRRALLITHPVPARDVDGSAAQGLFEVEALLDAGWSVTVVAEGATAADAGRVDVLRQRGAEVYAGPASRGRQTDHLSGRDAEELVAYSGYDLALVHFWGLAERWTPILRAHSPGTRVLVDMIDLHLARLVRTRLQQDDPGDRIVDLGLMRPIAGEINAYAAADGVLSVSEAEAGAVELLLGRSGFAHHVPLGREVPADGGMPFHRRRGLLFTGNFRHAPNEQAARSLAEEVLPRLPEAVRSAHPMRFVGSGVSAELRASLGRTAGADVVGWVPELAPELERARLLVAPLQVGAGVKNKVLDAMAAGLPVLTNAVGIEGLDLTDGREVVLVEDPDATAKAIVRLLGDEAAWTDLADRGRRWIAEHASVGISRDALHRALDHALRA